MQPRRPLLSFALVDERPVFMDEAQDSYFTLDAQRESEFVDWLRASTPRPMTSALRDALGVADEEALAEARCVAARQTLLDDLAAARVAFPADAARIAAVVLRARRRIRTAPIAATIESISARPAMRLEGADAVVADRVARFTNARRLVPVRRHCLVDCLALVDWLGPLATGVQLVFGVKLHPFAAHCWLQRGPLLLNDYPEEVAPFTPVRVVDCTCASR